MIRVLLVDDQHLIRAGLRMLCDAQPDIEVVGEADSGREAIPLAGRLLPDVVVMDLRMPGVDGITATSRILAERPATRVLVLTTFGDDDHLYPALTAGACGFLLKDAPPTELLDGIRRAAVGDSPFSPEVLRRLVQRAVHARPGSPPALPGLTARERDVLNLVAEGLSNTEIADQLHIGVTTVKTHITSLMTKTDSPNRVRLALFARGV
ncbi:response regulator transcription factor [Micromonospora arida]|uniref:Chemotaxis response regulator protein-glutamate methylesterase of group 1 operon n=2 Tax=Micromonospora TaxID=1873 RepID=A0ABX9D7W3_9ACTN|nr:MULTISPECIES: response regulator transcription factor [Micromonospora]RAO01616.1 Chemotaxis response regulator protein-glutamate methylesterase of group 1 operon [Micromonospora saelicesensis]RAO17541.1 Chemotaxis response regulator protein-glutamate methylesterase of group 1 operon [Micromonospora noduli]RAO19394.1 Chemotaxis response regulator protein-glutamate methylesterase of group 1 operon [Micromonospora noduli]RAO24087.1 Chemotaxis response regulator protein-glutamate methylesterase 